MKCSNLVGCWEPAEWPPFWRHYLAGFFIVVDGGGRIIGGIWRDLVCMGHGPWGLSALTDTRKSKPSFSLKFEHKEIGALRSGQPANRQTAAA